jgi:hypothetical protein
MGGIRDIAFKGMLNDDFWFLCLDVMRRHGPLAASGNSHPQPCDQQTLLSLGR